jgi:hypothetical protein
MNDDGMNGKAYSWLSRSKTSRIRYAKEILQKSYASASGTVGRTGVICLSLFSLMFMACQQKHVDRTAINPLDTIPFKPIELSGNESGYYKSLFSDGSLQWLGFKCDGLREGPAFIFQEDGLISYYTEYEEDRMILKITYKLNGALQDCWQKGGGYWVNRVDTFPPHIKERLDFVAANCPKNSAINWNAILTDDCD